MQMTKWFTRSTFFKSIPLNSEIAFRAAEESDLSKMEWLGEYTHFRRVFRQTYQDQRLGRRIMLVADFNHFPIGHIFLLLKDFWGGDRGYLYALRVMAPFQGMGIGTELVKQAERILLDHRLDSAMIAVAKDNPGAKRLYDRLGYVVYSEDDGRWSYEDHQGRMIDVYEPCWMMEKRLK